MNESADPPSKRKHRSGCTCLALLCLALILSACILREHLPPVIRQIITFVFSSQNRAHLTDDTPLPQGPIREPSLAPDDASSSLRFKFRMALPVLQRILNKSIPKEFPIPENEMAKGNVRRSDIQLSAMDRTRLKLDGTAQFAGSAKWKIWEATSATADYSGSSISLEVLPTWNWRFSPQVQAKLTAIDVSWAPDFLAKWLANMFIPSITSGFSNTPPFAFRPAAESFWKEANQDIKALSEPLTMVGLRPQSIALGGPIMESDGSLHLTLGMDVQSWVIMGGAGENLSAHEVRPLPDLKKVKVAQESSELRLPVMVSLKEAAGLFRPQSLEVPGGTMKILGIDLSDQNGICYVRARVRFDVKEGQELPRPFSGDTTLVVQGRPSCDRQTGEILLSDFQFTPKSESILVEILGNGVNVLQSQLQGLAPVLSGWIKNRLDAQLNAECQKFLDAQVQEWAKAVPDLATEIRGAKPEVKHIQIKPIRVEVTHGYFILVVQASADLSLAFP